MVRLLIWLAIAYLVYRFIKALVLELTGGSGQSSERVRKGTRHIDAIPDADFEEIKDEKKEGENGK
jgi:hypothetical protein